MYHPIPPHTHTQSLALIQQIIIFVSACSNQQLSNLISSERWFWPFIIDSKLHPFNIFFFYSFFLILYAFMCFANIYQIKD